MAVRSQAHMLRTGRSTSGGVQPNAPITGINPDTATLAAAGAVGRTIATLSVVGGTAPITYALVTAAGVSASFTANVLKTTVDPCGTAGVKTMSVSATDAVGQTKTETLAVTLT